MIRVFNQYVSVKSILLMAIEGTLIVLSLVAGARLRFWSDPVGFLLYTSPPAFLMQALTVPIVLVICCYYNDLYGLKAVRLRGEQFVRLAQALGAGCILLGTLYYLVPELLIGRGVLFIAIALAAATISGMRVGLDRVWQLTAPERNVLILGDGEMALATAREFERRADLNFRVVGFVAPPGESRRELFGRPVLGDTDGLCEIVRDQRVSRIVVALADLRGALPARELVRLRAQGIEVEDAHSTLAALTGRVWLRAVRPSWFVFSGGFHRSSATLLIKRAIDLALGLLGLVLLSPVMALIAIAIRLDSKGPALYRQARVGLGGRVF